MSYLNDILNNTNLYLTVKDKNFKYVYANEKYAEFLGFDSTKSIIGKNDFDIFPESIANIFVSGDAHVLNGGTMINRPEIIIGAEKRKTILTSKTYTKKHDRLAGIVVSFIEIDYPSILTPPKELMKFDENKKIYPFKIDDHVEYFTKKEYEVFKKLFLGLSAKQIAVRMSLSQRTVEDYLNKIKNKLQCSYKYNIIETAIRHGILQSFLNDFL